MGKRELVLILGFVIAGIAVYQVAAPDRPDDRPALSVSGIVERLRSHLRGERASATATRNATAVAPDAIHRLVLEGYRGKLAIVGADRDDVSATLEATVFGGDDADARKAGEQVALTLTATEGALDLAIALPPQRRRPLLDLRVEVPRRLAVRIEGRGEMQVDGVAAVELETRAGAVALRDIAGPISGEHREGAVSATHVRDVQLVTRRATVRLEDVKGTVGGELIDGRALLRDVAGRIGLETNRMEVDIERATGGVTLASHDGTVTLRDAGGPVSFEGERCRLTITASRGVPISASSSDAIVDLQWPTDGVTLDATAVDGRIDAPGGLDGAIKQNVEGATSTAIGPHAGGGVAWRIRSTRGDIILRR